MALRVTRRMWDSCGTGTRYPVPCERETSRHLQIALLTFFSFRIGDAELREAVAEGIAGEAEGAGGLALVSIGAAEGFADGFVFPLFEGHARRQDVRGIRWRARGGIVEINVGDVECGSHRCPRRRAEERVTPRSIMFCSSRTFPGQ